MAEPIFTNHAERKMRDLSLSEADVLHAFRKGVKGKFKGAKTSIKKYSGYEVGMMFKTDPRDGREVITHVWKRERR